MGTHCWRHISHSMPLRTRSKREPQYEHALIRLFGKLDRRGPSAAVIPDLGAAHGSRTSSGSCVADEAPNTITIPPSLHDSGMCEPGMYHRFSWRQRHQELPILFRPRLAERRATPPHPEEGREPC